MSRMMLSPARLKKLLVPLQFSLLFSSETTKEIHFARRSDVPRLYDCLMISGQGKHGEAVYAQTAVSAAPFHPDDECVSVTDQSLLSALETDKDKHWTIVENSEQAEAWEQSLANLADQSCRETSRTSGPGLFERLHPLFDAFDRYVDLLGDTYPIFDEEHRFLSEATNEQKAEAERLSSGHGDWHDRPEDIELACFVLVKYGNEVEGVPDPFQGKKLPEEPELRARIFLLTDYIRQQREVYSA